MLGVPYGGFTPSKFREGDRMRRSIWLVAMGAVLAFAVGQSAVAAETAQQEKMTTCNADAKTKALKGDERKAFMKTCLSGPAA